jgi:hypothetical protein
MNWAKSGIARQSNGHEFQEGLAEALEGKILCVYNL